MILHRMCSLVTALTVPLALAVPAAGDQGLREGTPCRSGPAASVLTALVGSQVVVEGAATIEGLDVVVGRDPMIAPGVPVAALAGHGGWCPVQAINHVIDVGPSAAERVLAARAFAAVAGIAYLGRVEISDVRVSHLAGISLVGLRTSGGRHGAVSDWMISVDRAGVRAATFTTVALAGLDDGAVGSLEGLTSLPGHSRHFLRDPDGLVHIDATPRDLLARSLADRDAAVARAAALTGRGPGDDLAHTFADGQTVKISYGMSPYTPDPGMPTVEVADRVRSLYEGLASQYRAFLRAGMADPFDNTSRTIQGEGTAVPDEAGYVNVDSAFGLSCFGCAIYTDGIEVHLTSQLPEIAEEFAGATYPDAHQFLVSAMGHEIFHSFQYAYSNLDGIPDGGFLEGLARASEAIHDNAGNNHQPGSVSYLDDVSGCNGFDNAYGDWIQAQAAGPFRSELQYESCYFFWTWLAAHGPEGLGLLLTSLVDMQPLTGDSVADMRRLMDHASPDGDGAAALATWAAAAAAGSAADGFTIAAGETGEELDWFALLEQAPRAVPLQASQQVELAGSGVRAFHVTTPVTVQDLPAGARTVAFSLDDGQLHPRPIEVGDTLASEEIVVVVAPGTAPVDGQLRVA